MHGGKAPQVAAAREARIIEMQAALEAGQLEPAKPRHAAEVLLGSIEASDNVMRQLQRDLARGVLSPAMSVAYGQWVDRAGRLSKLALDAQIDARMLELEGARLQRSAEELAAQLLGALSLTLRLAELSATTKLEVWRSWYRALGQIQREQVWPRLRGEAVESFRLYLERAAASEQTAAIESVTEEDAAWCGRCGGPIPAADAPGHCEACTDSELGDNVSLLWPRNPGGSVA